MKIEDIEQEKKYIDNMGNIVYKNNGAIWVYDGYQKWRFLNFIEERQNEILSELKEYNS